MDFYQAFRNRRTFSLQVTGESMNPLFCSGDIVHFRQVAFDRIKVNDIVLVRNRRVWFAHRVVYRTAGFLITQGDNNQHSDGIITARRTVGRAEGITRSKKRYQLKDIYTLQALRYQAETAQLQRSLQQSGVPFVFLKGLPLYRHYLGSIPQRLLADCDILVNPADSGKVDGVFGMNGYAKENTRYDRSFRDFAGEAPSEAGFAKYVAGFPVIFDVHYQLSAKNTHFDSLGEALRQLSGRMVSRRRVVRAEGEAIPLLAGNDEILFLLLHLANHLWGGFFRYDFLSRLLKKNRHTDWPEILDTAKKAGLINYCYPSLFFLAKFYKMEEPLEIYRRLYAANCRYSEGLLKLFFRCTVDRFNDFTLPLPGKINKFLFRFFLYDRPFPVKIIELVRKNFIGYAGSLLVTRIRRNRGSSGIGRRRAGPQASTHPAF